MNLRKLAGLAVLAFAGYYAITNPHAAAGDVHQLLSGVGTFFADLSHGGK